MKKAIHHGQPISIINLNLIMRSRDKRIGYPLIDFLLRDRAVLSKEKGDFMQWKTFCYAITK